MNPTKAWCVYGIVATVVAGAVFIAMLWVGQKVTEDDRRSRSDRAAACATIEDEQLRALCLFSVPGR